MSGPPSGPGDIGSGDRSPSATKLSTDFLYCGCACMASLIISSFWAANFSSSMHSSKNSI